MKNRYLILSVAVLSLMATFISSCDDSSSTDTSEETSESDFTVLLTNQINEVIIPTMVTYQEAMTALESAVMVFSSSVDETNLNDLRSTYQEAYLAYQATAVHNYFATVNQGLVQASNLYPIEVSTLEGFIEEESYNFNGSAQIRANGFPAMDYMLYGADDDIVAYFNGDPKRLTFLSMLVSSMKERSDALVDQWSGSLKDNFIANGGVQLGSSISVQLNESLVYYEGQIREAKAGIPIGLVGPNDDPIEADLTKKEAYYQSLSDGNDDFSLSLLRAAIEEIEDLYLGSTSDGTNDQGYDDLIAAIDVSIDTDIKSQFQTIYDLIDTRGSIDGDRTLYDAIQGIVTIMKADLFSLLNVQDADGANDGD